MRAIAAALFAAALIPAPWSALAHHAYAMYDRAQTLTLIGVVKDLQLVNPHGWLEFLAPDGRGNMAEYTLEIASPRQARHGGWSQDRVHPGDRITVRFHPLRGGYYGGQLVSAVLADGRVLDGTAPKAVDPGAQRGG